MSQAQLEGARLGFNQLLRRRRFSPQFINRNADDLFGTATLEYSRKTAEGEEIENPAGWLITCAWLRTKSLLEAESRSPRVVSTERIGTLTDEAHQSPEDEALEFDRARKVQDAVDQLSEDERRLLQLSYFEGLAVREAARALDWHPSKAQRCHRTARKHLHEFLGVDSLDELEIDIGLAAYVSLLGASYSALNFPPIVEAISEAISRGTAYGWARAQELARRFPLGGSTEPSATATLGSTAGRAAGVCATAALACLASGVVGPGVSGVNFLSGGNPGSPPAKSHDVAGTPRAAPQTVGINPVPPPAPREPERASASTPERQEAGNATSATATRRARATRAVRSQSLESAAGSPEEASSAPLESAPAAETSAPVSSGPSASGAGSTPTQIANEQFGP